MKLLAKLNLTFFNCHNFINTLTLPAIKNDTTCHLHKLSLDDSYSVFHQKKLGR